MWTPATKKLVEAFLAADIPLNKLHNPHIVKLFTDLRQKVPSESTCWTHVNQLAEKELKHVCGLLQGKIFLMVDESEIDKKKFLNILAGNVEVPDKMYLLKCTEFESVNQVTESTKIDDLLRTLAAPRENFVLLLSNTAAYMTV